MDRVRAAFEKLYRTPVEIYRLIKNSAYSEGGIREFVCSVNADIQHYNGELANMEFGQEIKKRLKMYCADCDDLCEGCYAKLDGTDYRIIYVEKRFLGIYALLERV